MRSLKTMIVVGALGVILAAGDALAQTPPPQTPPAQPPAAPPQPPQPFPEGARFAYIDLQAIVATSVEGKAGTAKLEEFMKKTNAELTAKQKQLEEMRNKLLQGGSVMSDQARSELERNINRATRELQDAQQDAQQDHEEMQQKLQADFLRKLEPVIRQISEEKALHMVFEIRNTAAIFAHPGLDLSAEVIQRFDQAVKAGGK